MLALFVMDKYLESILKVFEPFKLTDGFFVFLTLFKTTGALYFFFHLLNGSISFSNKVLFCILISRIRLSCATAVGRFSRSSRGTFLRGLSIFIYFFGL